MDLLLDTHALFWAIYKETIRMSGVLAPMGAIGAKLGG